MKISEQWLREWVDPNVSIQELAERLTMAGLEVDGLTAIGKDLQNIRVGEVLDAQPHPNADRLQVCQVIVGGYYTSHDCVWREKRKARIKSCCCIW